MKNTLLTLLLCFTMSATAAPPLPPADAIYGKPFPKYTTCHYFNVGFGFCYTVQNNRLIDYRFWFTSKPRIAMWHLPCRKHKADCS